MTPEPGSVLILSPGEIRIGFDRKPDTNTVDATSVILEASGGDGTFTDGNESTVTATSITVPVDSDRSLVFDLDGVSLSDDTYRFTIKGDGGSAMLDESGDALDGEYSASLPSGNGTAGGDFQVTFEMDSLEATLSDIQAKVLTPNCATSGCHEGPSSYVVNDLPEGMDLTNTSSSYSELVGVVSLQDSNFDRVEPNDPDNSYLIQKLEGTASEGQQMPRGADPLRTEVIAKIREWITNGANNN